MRPPCVYLTIPTINLYFLKCTDPFKESYACMVLHFLLDSYFFPCNYQNFPCRTFEMHIHQLEAACY